jgi:hypothetical protein
MPSMRVKILIAGQIICLVLIFMSLYLGRDKLTRLQMPSLLPGSSPGDSSQVGINDTTQEGMHITRGSACVVVVNKISGRRPVDCKRNSLPKCDPR